MSESDPRRVFVVHGRDTKTRDSLFNLLRAFGLRPIEWTEAVRKTGNTMPSILEVLRSGLEMPQAVVVLLTADDRGILRRQFRTPNDPDYEGRLFGQPRLNVVFEAGLACALFPRSTILVERGPLRPFTDIGGIDSVRIRSRLSWKSELRRRLETAGCEVDDNDAWLAVEGFHPSLEERWIEFDKHGRRFTDLLDWDELEEGMRSDELPGEKVSAFCLLSSIQEGKDMAYWVQANRTSKYAALLLTEFLVNSPLDHGRPRFRAARALELFDSEVRDAALSAAKASGGPAKLPLNSELIEAARTGAVEEYTRVTSHVKSEESRALLLTEFMQFPRHGEVRLV
jgi:Predicted nucleotide-binding protein containing TIR-like domain